jgi:hypothetical protein
MVLIDISSASNVKATRSDTKPRKAGVSRQSKRKAPAQAAPADDEQDSDAEQMEIDEAKVEEQHDDEVTPEPSDDGTDEEEAALPLRPAAQAAKEDAKGAPPPKRELPFGRTATRARQSTKEPSPPADEDDDTEEEEL